jgi:hypothetical protein
MEGTQGKGAAHYIPPLPKSLIGECLANCYRKKMRKKIDSTDGGTSCGDPMQGRKVGQYHVFLTNNFAFLGDY